MGSGTMKKQHMISKLPASRRHLLTDDTGSATAEYAIATLAAVGFAGLLVVILRSGEVRGMLTDLIHHALSIPG
jgi:Flp pilus assembly pilin Flp